MRKIYVPNLDIQSQHTNTVVEVLKEMYTTHPCPSQKGKKEDTIH